MLRAEVAAQEPPPPPPVALPVGIGLLTPPPERGPLTLRPSVAVSEEYNDNILLSNDRRRADVVAGLTLGVTLTLNDPRYRVVASGSTTAEIYARERDLDEPLARQTMLLDAVYQVQPGVTLTVVDAFVRDLSTNLISPQQVSVGRQEAWSNTLAPAVTWQATPRATVRLAGTGTWQRFQEKGRDSDVYRVHPGLEYALAPRLSGLVTYEFKYLVLESQTDATVHTPGLGASYQITKTLTGAVTAGPSLTVRDGTSELRAAGTASLEQELPWGTASVEYERTTGPAGGLAGVMETETLAARLQLDTLRRGLTVAVTPRYLVARTLGRLSGFGGEVEALYADVRAVYRVARFFTVTAAYTFFRQRVSGLDSTLAGVDQNRVTLAVQFAYPFNFE